MFGIGFLIYLMVADHQRKKLQDEQAEKARAQQLNANIDKYYAEQWANRIPKIEATQKSGKRVRAVSVPVVKQPVKTAPVPRTNNFPVSTPAPAPKPDTSVEDVLFGAAVGYGIAKLMETVDHEHTYSHDSNGSSTAGNSEY